MKGVFGWLAVSFRGEGEWLVAKEPGQGRESLGGGF